MAENTSAIEGVKETVKTVVYALLIAGIFRTLFSNHSGFRPDR